MTMTSELAFSTTMVRSHISLARDRVRVKVLVRVRVRVLVRVML